MLNFKSKITTSTLNYFFLHPDEELFANEIARKFSLDSGNCSKKLHELEIEGILKSRTSGNQKYYSINKEFFLYHEYRQITLKTVGIEAQLKETLNKLKNIKQAFIFGSYVENKMDTFSDIDLFVITELNSINIYKAISPIEKNINRAINIVTMGEKEFHSKQKTDDFVKNLMTHKIIELI